MCDMEHHEDKEWILGWEEWASGLHTTGKVGKLDEWPVRYSRQWAEHLKILAISEVNA